MTACVNRKDSSFDENLQYWYEIPCEDRKHIIQSMSDQGKLVYLSASPDFLVDIPEDFFKSVKFVRSALILETNNDSHDILIDFRTTDTGIRVSASRDLFNTVNWQRMEPGNIIEIVGKYFQNVISKTIKLERIVIDSALFPFNSTSIRHLKNLKEVEINNGSPINLLECGFIDFEQLCHIEKSINFTGLYLTMLQLQQMNAENIQFRSMHTTSEEINQHLKMFLNNELNNITNEMELFMDHENELSIRKVIRGLKLLGRGDGYGATTFVLVSADTSRVAHVSIESHYVYVKMLSRTSFFHQEKYLSIEYGFVVFDHLISSRCLYRNNK